MNEQENEFDDPGLKAAVRRTIGHEHAPPSLRAKVQSLLAAEATVAAAGVSAKSNGGHANGDTESGSTSTPAAPSPRRRRLVIDRSFWRTAAAAAVLLIALGFMFYQIREAFPPSPFAGMNPGVTAVPASLVQALTNTHDSCAKLPDHHKIPGDNPEALHEKLTASSGVVASTISLGGDWKFKGAGVCQVGDKQAAHLLFVRAEEYISIFSMPAPDECGYGGDSYRDYYDKHPVAGFRHGDALYCVVGSRATGGDMPREAIDPALQKMQASVASGCTSHDAIVAAAAPAPAAASSDQRR